MSVPNIDEAKSRRAWLLAIYACGVAAIIGARFVRGQHLWQGGLADLVLGSLPNFIAAACLPPLVMSWRKRTSGMASGLSGAAIALAIVLAWEAFQYGRSGMRFDSNDIVASVLGGVAWVMAWAGLDRWLRCDVATVRTGSRDAN